MRTCQARESGSELSRFMDHRLTIQLGATERLSLKRAMYMVIMSLFSAGCFDAVINPTAGATTAAVVDSPVENRCIIAGMLELNTGLATIGKISIATD